MRRIIHNTTAIAACLSIIAPSLTFAETRIPDAQAQEQMQTRAEKQPKRAAALQAELDAGLTADQLACLDGAERPCADGVLMLTPGGLAVDVSEGGQIYLAKAADQKAAKEAAAAPAEPEQAEAPAAEEAVAEEPQEQAAEAQEPAEEPEAQPEQVEAERPAQMPEATAETRADDTRPEEKAPISEDDLAKALSQQAEPEAQDNDQAEEPQPAPAPQEDAQPAQAAEQSEANDGTMQLSKSDAAQKRAGEMPRLYRILEAEVAAGLEADQLSCLSGGAYPCGDGERMLSPGGVVLEQQKNGRFLMAGTRNQMYRVNDEGKLVQRAAEEDTVKTEAAKEAAEAKEAPKAAALDDNAGKGEVVEQEVTEANTRSSDEDFATNLRDALASATGQQPTASNGDDDDNDLTKALLLGLGAVAVGSMLNNNRQVALSTPDRVVVTRQDGSQEVIKDEVALLRQPGATVATENFDDGSSRTVVTRTDGSKVVTIRDADLRVLRRTLISADGTTTRLIDDTAQAEPVDIAALPAPAPVQTTDGPMSEDQLRAALQRETAIDRRFTLGQIRNIPEVRALVAPVNIDAITFDTGSAAIKPDQARQLSTLGKVIQDAVADNPREMFLIEGHTDTVGSEAMNLALSDRRAESVALALTEYFDVPPENMLVQGYGEQFLKIRSEGDIRENRRASVRRITDLLQTAAN